MNADKVFVSYASADRACVGQIANVLEEAGIAVWRDEKEILGGECYGPAIVEGIQNSRAIVLMCSDRSFRSKNVNQEIRLAWKYSIPYIPLLLEKISYPEQVEYWLEGNQWIEVLDEPHEKWLPTFLRALERITTKNEVTVEPRRRASLDNLRRGARFTDRIWPVAASAPKPHVRCGVDRGLGASQSDAFHEFRLGSWVRLIIDSPLPGHVLILDEGPEGIVYCLCPSLFAPRTTLVTGQTEFPQPESLSDAFKLTGRRGREHLLAIITNEPLPFDWSSNDPRAPARMLSNQDLDRLLETLEDLAVDAWLALATYFDVTW